MDTGLDAALSDSLNSIVIFFSVGKRLKLHPHVMEYYKRLVCFHSSFFLIGYKATAWMTIARYRSRSVILVNLHTVIEWGDAQHILKCYIDVHMKMGMCMCAVRLGGLPIQCPGMAKSLATPLISSPLSYGSVILSNWYTVLLIHLLWVVLEATSRYAKVSSEVCNFTCHLNFTQLEKVHTAVQEVHTDKSHLLLPSPVNWLILCDQVQLNYCTCLLILSRSAVIMNTITDTCTVGCYVYTCQIMDIILSFKA